METGVLTGLDMFHVAEQLSDDKSGFSYDTPESLGGAIEVQVSPKVNSGQLASDNGISDVDSILSNYDITPTVRSLTKTLRAKLLGNQVDSNGVLHGNADDQAPYFAFGFRAKKNNGKYVYVWYFKGKYEPFQEQIQTQGDQVNYQTPALTSSFIKRKYDNEMYVLGDEDDPNFTGGATWFDSVYSETPDTTAPTVTVTPADGASSVSASTTVQWVFDEAIRASALTEGNFMLLDSSNNLVDGTLDLSADQKTVTFTPDAALTSAASYQAIATEGVEDLAGNPIAEPSVSNFTVA